MGAKSATWWEPAEAFFGIKLRRATEKEACGPCPECGGDDRFRVWDHGRGWCRKCGHSVMWDESSGGEEKRRLGRKTIRQQAIIKMSRCTDWLVYNRACLESEKAMGHWAMSGISTEEIGKWGLGWCAVPRFGKSQSLTIPIFGGGSLLDIRHRLINPNGFGKYRSHFPGIPPRVFNSDVLNGSSWSVVVEGAKKAIIMDKVGISSVVSIPGVESSNELVSIISKRRARTVLALDPGVEESVARLVEKIRKGGGKVKVAFFPIKPDDFIMEYGVELAIEILKQAVGA